MYQRLTSGDMSRLASTIFVSSAILLFIVVANGQSTKLDCPDRVKDVAFSPEGKLLAAGYGWNNQGGARVWKTADNSVVATLTTGKGDGANVEAIAFSPDGRWFAVTNWNGDVMLWAVGSWVSHRLVLANRGSAKSVAFSPDTWNESALASTNDPYATRRLFRDDHSYYPTI